MLTFPVSYPLVMGILNVTPDSFFDGSRCVVPDEALRRVAALVSEGADIIDVGGESTRPGAASVSLAEELDRVVPVIEAIRREFDIPISVDTTKPAVMRAAVAAGAAMVNDIKALGEPQAMETAAQLNVPVCLMHMQGEPRTMQAAPCYVDVVAEVYRFLEQRVAECLAAGIARHNLVVDPGFGFGKDISHNLALLRELPRFNALGLPILVGLSRKSMFGAILGKPVEQRLYASVAAASLAVWFGAQVVRVHDVAATRDAIAVCDAVKSGHPREQRVDLPK